MQIVMRKQVFLAFQNDSAQKNSVSLFYNAFADMDSASLIFLR